MKQYKLILRRILLTIMIITTAIFWVLHYDSKEYTLQNEQEYINRICRMTHNRAVAVGIIDGNEDIFLEYCDIYGKNVDEHTLFELGSTTKAFTGLGILRLEEEGLIDLDAPVTDYIDWFKPQYKDTDAVVKVKDWIMCVRSRTRRLLICNGNAFDFVHSVIAEIQKKELMHMRWNTDFDLADPDSYNLAYQLQLHVCLDAL